MTKPTHYRVPADLFDEMLSIVAEFHGLVYDEGGDEADIESMESTLAQAESIIEEQAQ